jgi:hypothetical protein
MGRSGPPLPSIDFTLPKSLSSHEPSDFFENPSLQMAATDPAEISVRTTVMPVVGAEPMVWRGWEKEEATHLSSQ